jgi:lysophospholipase L1-like esterase
LAGENNNPAQATNYFNCAVTSEWKRYSMSLKCPAQGNFNFRFSYRGSDFLAWHPQVEDVTGHPSEEPSDYVAGDGSAVSSTHQTPHAPAIGATSSGLQDIACWGDSLTQGAGGKAFASFLQENYKDRHVFNYGMGGQTSSQIKNRFMAGQDKWADVTIIWAGRNNFGKPAQVLGDIADMVSKLRTRRFLILGVLNMNVEIKGTSADRIISRLNSDLAAAYPSNFIDMRSALVAAYDPKSPQDVADHANDVPPSSLRSDKIHLNSAGYEFVSKKITDFFNQNNWFTAKDKGDT